jgi:two-component system nitrogen regulation response regulator NtrX
MNTILIVDDMVQVAEVLKATLGQLNHNIVLAHTGEVAIEAAMTTPPALVILDYDLGKSEITGEEVCVVLRQSNPTLPIIVLSGVADSQAISDVLRACATTFIKKPYSAMYMIQLVEKLLGEE